MTPTARVSGHIASPPPGPAPPGHPRKKHFVSQKTAIALFAAVGIAMYLAGQYLLHVPLTRCRWLLLAVLVTGGAPLVIDLVRKAFAGNFGSDLLAGMSIITSALLGEYLAGSIVVLMLSGGAALEEHATRRASSVLGALAKRMPRIAHRKQGSELFEVDVSGIQIGERLVVFPHEVCPADGVVVEGRGSMDESYLTGEPFLIQKVSGATVLSGALNGDTVLTISVSRLPSDSRYAKIMRVMQAAEANRPQMRRIADRLGAWYTVLALGVAGLGWILSRNPTRFLAVLVIATPCPLLLAIPIAIIGAISLAASRGIIIKDPAVLEKIDTCRTAIFDKTGTLTYGEPQLTDVLVAPGIGERDVVTLVASLERYSKHPLSAAVLARAQEQGMTLLEATDVGERPGEGLLGTIAGEAIHVTSRKKLAALRPELANELPPAVSGMECVVLSDGRYAATFRFRDQPRTDGVSFVNHLRPKHHFDRMMIVSGDRESEVRYLAEKVGIQEVYASQSPEQKLEIVRRETRRANTVFLGDGINDAPALTAATVGIAFGQNSDITAEAAGAVIMDSSLQKVDELLHISRRMRSIALQSAIGGMALSAVGMILAAAGYLPPVAGAITQEVIDVLAVVNALRVAIPPRSLTDY